MLIDEGFRTAYRELEGRMKALAEVDGDVFLPNAEPLGRVQYVLVCMEPSLGRWARDPDDARSKVEAGFRNFLSSIEDFILHFCARHYLCGPAERYHITDFSKGAMLAKHAGRERTKRYDRWYALLQEEIELLCASPGSGVVAVGNAVYRNLLRRDFRRCVTPVVHYSPLAARHWRAAIVGREGSFRAFGGSVSLEKIVAMAEDVLKSAHVPSEFCDPALSRLKTGRLTPSRQELIFNYKLKFESMRLHAQSSMPAAAAGFGSVGDSCRTGPLINR
jgi:hypothetical protein